MDENLETSEERHLGMASGRTLGRLGFTSSAIIWVRRGAFEIISLMIWNYLGSSGIIWDRWPETLDPQRVDSQNADPQRLGGEIQNRWHRI